MQTASPSTREGAAAIAAEAQSALRQGQYAQAIVAYEKLVKLAPSVAEIHADLAVAYYFSGRFSDAARECQTALKLKPSLTHAREFLGPSLAGAGRCREALPDLEKDFPRVTDPQLRRLIGTSALRCAMALGDLDRAASFARPLTREFPDDPEVLFLATHAYSDLSTETSQRLLQTAPDSYQAHQLNAEVLAMEGKTTDAIAEYRKVLALDPHLAGVHYELGRLLLGNSADASSDAAKHEFEEELKVDPANAAAEYQLGEMASEARDWPEAISRFENAIRINPQAAMAYIGLGRTLVSAGRATEAVAPLERAVKLEPGNPDAHYQLAFAYRHAGRDQDAERELAAYRQTHEAMIRERQKIRTGINGRLTESGDTPQP